MVNFKTFCEFSVGFAFGSFLYLYFMIVIKGFPEILQILKKLRLPDNFE